MSEPTTHPESISPRRNHLLAALTAAELEPLRAMRAHEKRSADVLITDHLAVALQAGADVSKRSVA